MMIRRSLEGALKCALRDFRREWAIPNRQNSISIFAIVGSFEQGLLSLRSSTL
jgi:hypothetical protein